MAAATKDSIVQTGAFTEATRAAIIAAIPTYGTPTVSTAGVNGQMMYDGTNIYGYVSGTGWKSIAWTGTVS